jgi:hypothetical protein
MAKAVRWQIPFVSSIEKTQYRIDIYDEQDGTWSGVTTLSGGTSPIVTDEDASDDFFAPIRTQTGNIEVCTAIPGGGTLSLEDILPENNISRPVRLMSIAADMSEKIEWQGFLSCQAYNQAYTDIPEIIQLPINSVLEAMDSVPVSMDRIGGIKSISNLVYHILKEIRIQCGLPCFTHINYSADDFSIFSQLIDSTVLFALKEYNHEYSTTYIVDGMSCKEALTRICTFMGWVAREMKTDVVLERLCSDLGMYREEIEDFYGNFHYSVSYNSPLTTGLSIFDPYWRGTNHQQSITQGAKSVEVVAKLAKYEIGLTFPEFPYVQLQNFECVRLLVVSDGNGAYTNEVVIVKSTVSSDINFNNLCEFKEYKVSDDDTSVTPTTIENVFSESIINPNMQDYTIDPMDRDYVGAYMARVQIDDKDYMSGVYMNLMGADIKGILGPSFIASQTNYIFSIRSGLATTLMNGTMKISFNGLSFYDGDSRTGYYRGALGYYVRNLEKSICIRFGNKYFNGSTWQNSFTLVTKPKVETDDNGAWIIPIDRVTGELFIYFYPHNQDSNIPADITQDYLTGLLLTGINVEFEQTDNGDENDRGENRYFRLLGTNFRNEVSISTDLATTLNNTPSPSLILGHTLEPIKEITYYKDNGSDIAGATTEKRRPEIDLLNRLARYYQKARRKLNLIVRYAGTIPPKDRLVLRNDNKEYRPMAESCDWKNDTSDITFMEIPN